MIVLAILILLTLLIVSNVVLGIYNMLYPPCADDNDYFRGSKKLPDGVSSSLGSIPSGTDRHYVGAARVTTGIPGVVGLTSYNDSYINPNGSYKESMKNPVFTDDELDTEKDKNCDDDKNCDEDIYEDSDNISCDGDICYIKPSKITRNAYNKEEDSDAISAMFPTSSQKQDKTKKSTSEVAGYHAQFDMEMEGIRANISKKNNKRYAAPSAFSKTLEREGFQDDDKIDDSRDSI